MTRHVSTRRIRSGATAPTALLLALASFLGACGGDSPTRPGARAEGSLSVAITSGPTSLRQGDAGAYVAEARDADGSVLSDVDVDWYVEPFPAGHFYEAGGFVAYAPGSARIIARVAGAGDTLEIDIAPRGLTGSFEVVGQADPPSRLTSDLWVHGQVAYTGTLCSSTAICGDRMYVWDIGQPSSPTVVDSLRGNSRQVNDVKIRADGALGVMTHEQGNDNGIAIFDLTDPLHPTLLARHREGLVTGVHNVWIEGDYVYAIADESRPGASAPYTGELHVIDITDPADPVTAATFYGGSSHPHDVYVREGLAFLSHWDAGLIILDVGNGMAGGTPSDPVEVGRVRTVGGHTHNAWYWPDAGYVFVGEEDESEDGGMIHVVDARDPGNPVEVATFSLGAFTTPHNFWLDEERAILYAAWYGSGIGAIDVSGELRGRLDQQGREIARLDLYDIVGRISSIWAPQLHEGLVYASDTYNGLWVLRPTF